MQERSVDEIVELANIDSEFYKHHFFPKAFRQESPPCHKDLWTVVEDPANRYIGVEMPRDWAKTTNLRAYASKRVAYGTSRTIVIVGISEDAAIKTLSWLKRNVEFNYKWSQTYGLSKGDKWAGAHIEIKHDILSKDAATRGEPPVIITIIALGITGSTRGINIDDYRPDLILVDDPCDEENTNTHEQRTKIENLFFGALYNSLAARSDSPEAKMILLQTPLDTQDLISTIKKDTSWAFLSISVFTDDGKNSTWEAKYPYPELLAEKRAAIQNNRLHIWMREKEVTVISSATATFRLPQLKYWDLLPEGGVTIMSVDPTPPPKEGGVSSGKSTQLDDAVIMIIRIHNKNVYVAETYEAKSPNPDEFIMQMLFMARQWKVLFMAVETILFARVLKFYLEKQMVQQNIFVRIEPVEDKRKKSIRITQEVSGYPAQGRLYVHESQTKLIDQFATYPNVGHDDYLDALSIGLSKVDAGILELSVSNIIDGEYTVVDDDNQALLTNWRSEF